MPTTSFFDNIIEVQMASDNSKMLLPVMDQAGTKVFDTPGSTPPSTASEPIELKPRANKEKKTIKSATLQVAANDKVVTERSLHQADVSKTKPRKRGRPKNTITKDDLYKYPQEEIAEDGLPKDPRRRRLLKRNRMAATKCRNRKRDEMRELALQEHNTLNRHRYLTAVYESLNEEVYDLKTQLLCHSHCRCELIQTYIAYEARRSVDTKAGMPSASRLSENRSFFAASSSNNIKICPEAETTRGWAAPLHILPGVTSPASTGDDGVYENVPIVSRPSDNLEQPQIAVDLSLGFDQSAYGTLIRHGYSTGPMMQALTAQVGFWDYRETQ